MNVTIRTVSTRVLAHLAGPIRQLELISLLEAEPRLVPLLR